MANVTTDATFERDVLQSDVPVMVDFWSTTCAPCVTLGKIMDQISDMTSGHAKVYKLNVDENPNITALFGVRGLPTVLVFEKGEITHQIVGLRHPKVYIEALGFEIA